MPPLRVIVGLSTKFISYFLARKLARKYKNILLKASSSPPIPASNFTVPRKIKRIIKNIKWIRTNNLYSAI